MRCHPNKFNTTREEKGSLGWLDNAARQSRRYRLRRASYKLPLQVPAAKIVIDDPVELKYEAASCFCKDSVLTKVLRAHRPAPRTPQLAQPAADPAQYTPGGLENRLGCPPSAQSLVLARRTPKTRFGWDTEIR